MASADPRVFQVTLTAGADLSAKQHLFVKLDSNGAVVPCAAITDIPVGVLQNNPASGQAASVLVIGVTKLQSNGSVAIGDVLGTSSDAQADTIAPGTDTTVYAVGRALTAGTTAGDVFTALIDCARPSRAA